MTAKQALKKARRVFGVHGYVQSRKTPVTVKRKDGTECVLHERFSVGRIDLGMFFSVQGDGKTWEAAFEAAADRKRKDQERYAKIKAEREAA
jgi:hypothetical protein